MGRLVPAGGLRRAGTAAFALGAVLLAATWLHVVVGFGGDGVADLFAGWVYDAVMLLAASGCLLAAVAARELRLSRALIGLGLLSFGAASIIYSLAPDLDAVPVPSISDPLWLAVYPCEYAALLVLARRRIGRTLPATRLDGLQSGLAVASAVGCVTIPAALRGTAGQGFWTAATMLAYPVGDLVLLGAVVSAVALAGWRLDRTSAILGGAILAWEAADLVYLMDWERLIGAADALVLTGALGLAMAFARQPGRPERTELPERARGDHGLFVPIGFGLVAVGVLTLGRPLHLPGVVLGLGAASLVLALLRMALALRDNRRLLGASQEEATTDALTGLRNRRALKADLAEVLADGTGSAPHVLVLFDLNGFKAYNDAYGHNAGDDVLARLGHALTEAVVGQGVAYRMGGDEFCVLAPPPPDVDGFARLCAEALAERGTAFTITAAYGVVRLPGDSSEPGAAVALADARMYQNKNSVRLPAAHQSADVLVALLHEQAPGLVRDMRAVGRIAEALGLQLGLAIDDLEVLRHAAALHDIGKVAIPDTILRKPGPLTPSEWQLVSRHPVIGERILGAAPALVRSGRLIRSSHERMDGTGYPDGLAGEQIPLASRIISVADAFHAMTAGRHYAPARSTREALAELHRCAGAQFDAAVVDALERTLTARAAQEWAVPVEDLAGSA